MTENCHTKQDFLTLSKTHSKSWNFACLQVLKLLPHQKTGDFIVNLKRYLTFCVLWVLGAIATKIGGKSPTKNEMCVNVSN